MFCSNIIPLEIDAPYTSNIAWKFVKSLLSLFGSSKIIKFPPLLMYSNIKSFSNSVKSSFKDVITKTLQSSGTFAFTNKSKSSTSFASFFNNSLAT